MRRNQKKISRNKIKEYKIALKTGETLNDLIKNHQELSEYLTSDENNTDGDFLTQSFKKLGIKAVNAAEGDIIAEWMMKKSRKWPVLTTLFILLIALFPILISVFENTFYNPQLKLDALHDKGYWNVFILALPALVILLGQYFGNIPKILYDLVVNNVFIITKKSWETFNRKASKIYVNKFAVLLPYLIGSTVAVSAFFIFIYENENAWLNVSFSGTTNIAGIFVLLLTFIVYYLVGFTVIRIIGTYFVLKEFFKLECIIQPLHPDQCGGLSPLGSLSKKLNLTTFMFGIIAMIGIFANLYDHHLSLWHPINFVIIISYFIGASIAFFLPLLAAHKRMKDAKYKTIRIINDRFEDLNHQMLVDLQSSKTLDRTRVDEIESIRRVYDVASSMPVYPFNTKTVSSFIISLISPAVIFLLQELLKIFMEI